MGRYDAAVLAVPLRDPLLIRLRTVAGGQRRRPARKRRMRRGSAIAGAPGPAANAGAPSRPGRWDNRRGATRESRRGDAIFDRQAIAGIHDRFRDGDDDATRQVRDWVAAIVRGGGWRFNDPEAVIQEALLELVRVVRDGRVREPGGFQKFVSTVTKRLCVRQCYGERRRREHESAEEAGMDAPSQDAPPTSALERRDRLDALGFILQQMPGDCRGLWDQLYCRRRPADAVAQELNITVNNLRVRTHRCLERARSIFRNHDRRGFGREVSNA